MLMRKLSMLAAATVAAIGPALARAAEEHGEPLIPPVTGPESSTTFLQALWVIAIFVILVLVLYPTAWKNVLAGLKAREDRIRRNIADADEARVKAEASLKEYQTQLATAEQKVRDMIGQATAEGERVATSIRMQAQQEAEATKERAIKDIEAARTQALQEIYAQAAELSVSVAEKILRRNLNADDQRDLVDRSLAEMHAVGGRA